MDLIMTELREKIDNQLDRLSSEKLALVSSFLDSIEGENYTDLTSLDTIPPIKRGKKIKDLLKHANTWQGDDLEECLNFVRETRSKSKF